MNPKVLSYNQFQHHLINAHIQVIDSRLADYFEMGFIPGSINISLKLSKDKVLNQLIKPDEPYLLICKPGTEMESIDKLGSYGLNNCLGFLEGGFDNYQQNNPKYDMVISISSEEVVLDGLHNPKAIILDVRNAEAYEKKHLQRAINIPIEKLASHTQQMGAKDEIIVYCGGGTSSMLAASYLKNQGFQNVKNVWGGFERIKEEPKAILEP